MQAGILTFGIAVALALGSQAAYSQQESNVVQEAEEVRERGEGRGQRGRQERQAAQERMDEAEDLAEAQRDRAREQMENEVEDAEAVRERAEGEEARSAAMSRGEEIAGETPAPDARGRQNAAGRGSERAQEMRARRDERKSIQAETRGDRQMEADVDALPESDDADDAGDEDKPKKPWWKFWGE